MENENNEMENQTVLENIAEKTKQCNDGRDIKAMGEGYKAFSDADVEALRSERELDQKDRELDLKEREMDIQERQKDRELDIREQEVSAKREENQTRLEIAKGQEKAQNVGTVLATIASVATTVFACLVGPIKYASTIHGWEAKFNK